MTHLPEPQELHPIDWANAVPPPYEGPLPSFEQSASPSPEETGERARAVEAIAASPQSLIAIDWANGGGYGDLWDSYKFLRIAGQNVSNKPKNEKFSTWKESDIPQEAWDEFTFASIFREHELKELDEQKFSGVFFGEGMSYVARLDGPDANTYVLSFVSPQGRESRAAVRMIMTMPHMNDVHESLAKVDSDLSMLHDVFKEVTARLGSSLRPDLTIDGFLDGVKNPLVLSVEEASELRKLLVQKQANRPKPRSTQPTLQRSTIQPPKRRWFRRGN